MVHTFSTGAVAVFWISVAEIAYTYLLYPVFLGVFAWLFGKKHVPAESCTPSIAVVLPVYNEEKVIRKKIQNVFACNYPADKLELWIGSDMSSDRTEEIIRSVADPRIHLWVAQKRSGKAQMLNQLVPQIDADVLLFTDADIMFDAESIRFLAGHFADPSAGGVGGVTLHSQTDVGSAEEITYRNFEVVQKKLESMLHSTISAFGSFYAIRKKLFVHFHPHTYSNDDVIMPMSIIRQGYRMLFEPAAVSYEEPQRLGTEFKRRIRIGAGNFQAFFWLIDFLNPLCGWPWFCYVSHKVTRWFSPFFLLAAFISCGVLAFFGTAVIYKMIFITGMIFAVSSLGYRAFQLPILRHLFYFIAMNIALIAGFFRFLVGIRSAVWARTERKGHPGR